MGTDTVQTRRDGPRRAVASLCVLLLLGAVAVVLPAGAPAEQASQPSSTAAGQLDAGSRHTCAVLADSRVRCWGVGRDGELGYGNKETIGDDETPGSVGPVELGGLAVAVSAGDVHSCAILAGPGGEVRCWGFPGNGRLGYGDPNLPTIGDNETPASVNPVDLGGPAKAISAGGAHTCAILGGMSDGLVRCWGYGFDGELGYGVNPENAAYNIGDNEPPASVGPVDLGGLAVAIAAGGRHTCAILAGPEGKVRCWGLAGNGQLGYGDFNPTNPNNIGDNETPASVAPVELGAPAVAIAAGRAHTCAVLQGGSVRCWGTGGNGELGYGDTNTIGDNEKPNTVGPVQVGGPAVAISLSEHSCARLQNGDVRCWGYGGNGRLGYGNTNNIGDNETPASVAPVNLGLTATSIAAGDLHTCARLNDGNVRCWGYALNGRLGYCNTNSIGDDETPDAAGPVALTPGPACPPPPDPPTGGGSGTTPGDGGSQTGGGIVQPVPSVPPSGDSSRKPVDPLALQARRARDLRSCLAKAKRVTRSKRDSARRACMKRYGRTPGAVKGLKGAGKSKSSIVLSFTAPGTDGARPPAARSYLVKQSPSKIASARDFTRAQKLCKGRCRFTVTRVGTKINLTITNLRPKTTYYYAVAALDNVSARPGPRSAAVKAKTR